MYEILLEQAAEKDLKKLPSEIDAREKSINVMRIRHRKDVYR